VIFVSFVAFCKKYIREFPPLTIPVIPTAWFAAPELDEFSVTG
jgi:hypothetical protein